MGFTGAGAAWGNGSWATFPAAVMMGYDRVLFYQHNLAGDTFATTARQLTWNVANGYQLSVEWPPREPAMYDAAVGLQYLVLGALAADALRDYTAAGNLTRSRFAQHAVTANWGPAPAVDPAAPAHTLAPDGFLLASPAALAGLLTRFSGADLAGPGAHLLVVRPDPWAAPHRQLWHLLGPATNITAPAAAVLACTTPAPYRDAGGAGPACTPHPSQPASAGHVTFVVPANQSAAYYRLL